MMAYFTKETDPAIDFDNVDQTALAMLEEARHIAGIPFHVTSNKRTSEHSVAVGGLNNDAHTEEPCSAFDIAFANTEQAFIIISSLLAVGFKRVGINALNKHVHADNSQSLPTPRFWVEGILK